MNNIHVVMRMCSVRPEGPDKARPMWFNKENTFRSVFLTRDSYTDFTVLFDGDSTGHWIHNYPVRIISCTGGSDESSIMFQLQHMISQSFDDESILYSLEDDYVHKPNWCDILREGLGSLKHPLLKFDYITLYDHCDKYTYDMYTHLSSRIGISKSVHWRTVPSTTNTWAARFKTFKRDYPVFIRFKNLDNTKFLTLGRNGVLVGSCIPGYSTHVHMEHMSPHTDWERFQTE